MASNRLSIRHPASGKTCVLASTMLPYGAGWRSSVRLEERLDEFLVSLDEIDPGGQDFFLDLVLEEEIKGCSMPEEDC